ncbi:hypothetical protein B0I35DRAFT_408078 [Stachybotrys elegans]|uniref:GmrSD restriction endonucleases C-terminal domain-containing protein n=1 Tax=Stachybotrys elegans TaxID=80388 RepID=A0A8K0SZK4_9HYPO|nr:hypothetical protein B0I35DRAFT_408078 [Stachybotrys elegans]
MKLSASLAAALASTALAAPTRFRTPPGIPSSSVAYTLLSELTVADPSNEDSYDRDLFPHWSTVEGSCNTREYVLQRDGDNVEVNDSCAAQSGTWYSPFDGATWTAASDVDIDHMVPLKNAWISGAASWSTSEREAYANDITGPALWAVTDEVNQEKSDRSPDSWKPPLTDFYCTYASAWIQVKSTWELSVTEAEYSALEDMLGTC